MRNLKKILALVLALVMSLSLMSVAGATEFPDSDQISETYAESVDVLTGLKVFQGNKGEFKPKDNITRAEVANIIYRIVTGDVDGTSVGIYADYNKFTDVPNTAWFAGCVNYCANAEYIKGRGNGKFDPYGNVTGYEALAMILRAIGYDKNGEFTGANWQIQTAATARNRGITKNIVEGTLGVAASREMVAEILCQTILVPVADYSLAFGYRTTDAVTGKENETLAKKTFKMEKLTGVVTANQYADLNATSPLGTDQTKIGDKVLNVHSTLDDLGESRYVYVIPQSGTTRYDLVCSKVYDTGDNNVYDSGDEVKTVGNDTGKDNGITSIVGATHLRNYSPMTDDVSDWRIEYVIKLGVSEYVAKTMFRDNGNASNSKLTDLKTSTELAYNTVAAENETNWSRIYNSADGYTYEYRKVITVGDRITGTDKDNIKNIFAKSTHIVTPGEINPIGEVYVGTSTRPNEDDISNKISHAQFVETYLTTKDNTIGYNGLGNRLKIVDNDNDGVAEYVLQTVYTVAMVTGTGSKITLDTANVDFDKTSETNSGVCHTTHTVTPLNHVVDNCNEISTSTKTAVYGDGELATGDVVLYALIDGVALMEKANGETAKIDKVVRTARTATTVDGTEYKESAVHEHSASLTHTVANLVGNTTYNLYFDKYGNLAAFTEGTNGDFVLITDGWFDSRKGGDEYAARAFIDGSLQTVDITGNGSMFIDGRTNNPHHTFGQNNDWGMLKDLDNLNDDGHDVHTTVAQLQDGTLVPVDKSYLYSQTFRMLEMQNNVIPGRDNQTASKAKVHFTEYTDGEAYLRTDNNLFDVRALSNTVYYTVYNYYRENNGQAYNTVVRQYTGYNNVPTIARDAIEDVYAVGRAATDANGNTYYTASIVVIELDRDYTKRDSEQVFIPEFSTVGTAVGREEVTMIRGNGTIDTVTVDLRLSKTRGYDAAGNTRTAAGGLYFMDESDTEKGVYIVEYMSQPEIQASNYAIGFVRANTAVAGEDWTSVNLYTNNGGVLNPYMTTDNTDVAYIARRHNNSHYYTLGYDGIYNNNTANLRANLQEVTDKYAALEQNPSADLGKIDSENSQLNETEQGRKNHLNEVLMAYNDAGDIIYTVSFREYRTGTTRDHAQTVWLECMPTSYDATSGNEPVVEFYGQLSETVYFNQTTNPGSIVVKPGSNNAISSVCLVSATAGSTSVANGTYLTANVDGWYSLPVTPLSASDAVYVLDVVYPQGNGVNVSKRYTLTQKAAVITVTLDDANTNGVAPDVDNTNGTLTLPATRWLIADYVNNFQPTNKRGHATWTFTMNSGETFQVTWDGAAYDTSKVPAGADTGVISGVNVVVTDENNANEKTYVLQAVANAITTASTDFNSLVENNLKWDAYVGTVNGTVQAKDLPGVGAVILQGFSDINAATTEAQAQAAGTAAWNNAKTAVKTALKNRIEELLGGRAPNWSETTPIFNNWNTTLAGFYNTFMAGVDAGDMDKNNPSGVPQLWDAAARGILGHLSAAEEVKPVDQDNRSEFGTANTAAGLKSITAGVDANGNETRTVTMTRATLQSFLANAASNTAHINTLKHTINGTDYLFIGVGWKVPTGATSAQVLDNTGNWVAADSPIAADGNFYEYFSVAKSVSGSWVILDRNDPTAFTFRFVDGSSNVIGGEHTSMVSVVLE